MILGEILIMNTGVLHQTDQEDDTEAKLPIYSLEDAFLKIVRNPLLYLPMRSVIIAHDRRKKEKSFVVGDIVTGIRRKTVTNSMSAIGDVKTVTCISLSNISAAMLVIFQIACY